MPFSFTRALSLEMSILWHESAAISRGAADRSERSKAKLLIGFDCKVVTGASRTAQENGKPWHIGADERQVKAARSIGTSGPNALRTSPRADGPSCWKCQPSGAASRCQRGLGAAEAAI
jgi:hypothetical protein